MKNQDANVLAQSFHGRSVGRVALVAFCLFLLTFASTSAVDLFVSGILTPAAANGRYVPNGTYSGYDSWVHESGGYYIYNDFYSTVTPALRYWNIDNDLNDEGTPSVYFYSSNNSDGASPALVTAWAPDQGSGTPVITAGSAYPEIDIQGKGITISDGSAAATLINHTHFGAVNLSAGSATRTFTIRNLGAAALTLSGASPYVTVSGTHAANFVVSAAPAVSIPAAGSTTFQVTFTPTAAGNHNASLSIASDDADESPYTFAILGRGFTPRDLVVTGITAPAAANGTYLHQGVIFDMEYWKHETLDYFLFNDEYGGTRYWNIDVDTNDDDTDYLFFFASEAGTPVGMTGWSRGTGITGDPLINEANPAPDIMVRGNGVVIADDDASPAFADHTQFGSLTVSSGSRARTFTIENTGNAVLTLTGPSPYVAVSGAAAGDFSVTTPPAATIAAYGSTTFTVTFDAAAEGTRAAVLSIASDDEDESPYNFSIQGNGVVAKNLIVSGITAPAAANGTYIYQGILNEFPYWMHEGGGYYIYNDDFSGSRYWNIDVDMEDTTSLFYSTAPSEASTPISVPSWYVVAGSGGTPVIAYAGPEIVVEGNSFTITDGDASPSATDHTDFGSIALSGGSLTRTFTIRNSGSETLTLTAASPFITIGGDAASDFSVTALPESSIAAGSTSTFTISFTPSAMSVRSAILSIANDDTDENPYDFAIQGTGLAVAPVVTTQAVTAITATGASGNGTLTSLGVPNPTAHGVCWNTTGAPTLADNHSDAGAAAATGAFSTAMGGLSAYTTYHVRAYATNVADTSYGGEVTFTTSAVAPTVTTQAVTAITATGANGNGTITDLGAPAPTAHGVCWNTTGAPTLADSTTNEGAATATGTFLSPLTGLAANTAYFVRSYATNSAGTAYGGEVTFTTSAVIPTVTTMAAGGITTSGATLNGTVSANNQSAAVTFEYGPTIAYGTTLVAAPSPVTGALATPIAASVSGLLPNSIYHFRAAAENATGAAYGSDMTFTTLPAPPSVVTQSAVGVTSLSATLNGTVNANNQTTVVTFQYGLTTAYGTVMTASPSPVDGTSATAVTRTLTGLTPETTYHFRAVGQNAAGTTYGADLTFATPHLNIAPSANDDDFAGMEDEALRVPAPGVLRNDSDPEASPLRAVLLTQTGHGRVTLHADGSFVYSPDAGYNGLDRFFYAASDGELESAAAEVVLRIQAVNDPPTIAIRTPADGARVNGILTIMAEAHDDRQVARVDFFIDGAALNDTRERTIDLGDQRLDVSDGLALALDSERNLLLLTNDLQARMLLGAEAGIEDVCTDLEGRLCLQRRDGLGTRWLRIDSESGKAEALAASDFPRQPLAMGVSRLRRSLFDRGDDGWIAIRNGKPTGVDLMAAAAMVRSWPLPLTRIEQARRRESWLALQGEKDGERTIFLIDAGGDSAGVRTFTSKPLADWDVLADGTLLIGRPAREGVPSAWGTWRHDSEGWSFREGQALPHDLAALATLPKSRAFPGADAAEAGGTYTRVWNTWGAATGPHTIEVVAHDEEGTSAADSITVTVENILLTLDIKRKSEQLWIIRHDYAEIAVTVDNPNRIDVSSYVLERGGDGAWATIREIAPTELQDNHFSCTDNDIEASKPYTYRLRAVDRDGATIATSPSVTI